MSIVYEGFVFYFFELRIDIYNLLIGCWVLSNKINEK